MKLLELTKYDLIEYIGNGAFGVVYQAHDRALNAIKAVKILKAHNPDDVISQLEEAQILHKCKHKNIVLVNEANIYEIDSIPHIVIDMEYLSDGSLEQAINNRSLSINVSIQIIMDALFGLEHAHFIGVLHRDIKPANILLSGNIGKLSDFGLATILGERSAGSSNGYVTHLPPEFFFEKNTTELTDVFAMGMTLFRAVNYVKDWDNVIESIDDHIDLVHSGGLVSKIGYKPFIPTKLIRIINKAISPNPDKRYQSAREFCNTLAKLRPNIDWRLESDTSFIGNKANDIYHIELLSAGSSFRVNVRRNARKINADCRHFSNQKDAYKYLYGYVSNSQFN
ncbi:MULTISPECIES: serine/threonine-protein kinase [Acinetobacter]|uniref:serine/threonine-protein kinase n=1 Tax=Acinetobacter TaxID=469 RepID=UPI001900E9D1|nr:serine/threonine-protein kinase [Acinetobacter bereziniae]MBJ8554224.1 serine/threonine protein kinase [Acinetobacter bereziniae]